MTERKLQTRKMTQKPHPENKRKTYPRNYRMENAQQGKWQKMHTQKITKQSHLAKDRIENAHPENDRKITYWKMTQKSYRENYNGKCITWKIRENRHPGYRQKSHPEHVWIKYAFLEKDKKITHHKKSEKVHPKNGRIENEQHEKWHKMLKN